MPLPARWFSEHFGITEARRNLPFVDFDLSCDLPVFINPHSIAQSQTALGKKCHQALVSWFQCLLDAVAAYDRRQLRNLLSGRLSEPKEIYFGLGEESRSGAGWGPEREESLIEAIQGSRALRTGSVHDIREFELHIYNVGPDMISDLTANIIKLHLAEYTHHMCSKYKIPKGRYPFGVMGWNTEQKSWDFTRYTLPEKGYDRFLLVPKEFVCVPDEWKRYREACHKHVLRFIQAEMNARGSLERAIKSNSSHPTPRTFFMDSSRNSNTYTLTEVRKITPLDKRSVSNFIVDHPEVMARIREDSTSYGVRRFEQGVRLQITQDDKEADTWVKAHRAIPQNEQIRFAQSVHTIASRVFSKHMGELHRVSETAYSATFAAICEFALYDYSERIVLAQGETVIFGVKNTDITETSAEIERFATMIRLYHAQVGLLFCRHRTPHRILSKLRGIYEKQHVAIVVLDNSMLELLTLYHRGQHTSTIGLKIVDCIREVQR